MGFRVLAGFVVYVFFQCDFILAELGSIQGKLRFAFLESLKNLHSLWRTGLEFRMVLTIRTGKTDKTKNKQTNNTQQKNKQVKNPGWN